MAKIDPTARLNEFPKWIKDLYWWVLKRDEPINELFVNKGRTMMFSNPIYNNTKGYNYPSVQEHINSLQG